jgi:hypothetical protein
LRRRHFIIRLGDRNIDERKACQRCGREADKDEFFHFVLPGIPWMNRGADDKTTSESEGRRK